MAVTFNHLSRAFRFSNKAPLERALWLRRELKRMRSDLTYSDRLFFKVGVQKLEARIASRAAFIPIEAEIGDGVTFPHDFNGIHIAREAVIGLRCTIVQNVTIGVSAPSHMNIAPVIGDDVYIGAGAVIAGRCHIGNGAKIGAGVVLVNVDVPPGHTVVNKSAFDLTEREHVYPQD